MRYDESNKWLLGEAHQMRDESHPCLSTLT